LRAISDKQNGTCQQPRNFTYIDTRRFSVDRTYIRAFFVPNETRGTVGCVDINRRRSRQVRANTRCISPPRIRDVSASLPARINNAVRAPRRNRGQRLLRSFQSPDNSLSSGGETGADDAAASLERKRADEATSRFYGIDVRGCCERRGAEATCELIYRFHGFEITSEHPLFIASAFSLAPRRARPRADPRVVPSTYIMKRGVWFFKRALNSIVRRSFCPTESPRERNRLLVCRFQRLIQPRAECQRR